MSKRPERSPRGERPSRGPRRDKPATGRGPSTRGDRRSSAGKEERSRDDERPARPRRPFNERNESPAYRDRPGKPGGRPPRSGDRPPPRSRDEGDRSERPRRSYGERGEGPSRPGKPGARAPFKRDDRAGSGEGSGPRRPSSDRDQRSGPRPSGPDRRGPRPERSGDGAPRRPGAGPRRAEGAAARPEKPWKRQSKDERTFTEKDPLSRRPFRKGERSNRFSLRNPANDGLIRLNRYLANAGVGSRRECDVFITSGAVKVNGKVVTELGTKVMPGDVVHFGEQRLSTEQKRYVLLNKPKDTITTTDDPQERHTVMHLIANACSERLYPVGRLDRHTTGVLLLTNDGDLAKRLTHPSHGAEKIYHVTLDKSVTRSHLHELVQGVPLDDGPASADEANYVEGATKREVGVKLHIGRNRIVRRMFEALGYEVMKLDRVVFAGLTKKELQRGHWRHLTEKEVTWLKQMKDVPKGAAAPGRRRTRLSQGSE